MGIPGGIEQTGDLSLGKWAAAYLSQLPCRRSIPQMVDWSDP